jgi:hypothetical protein
MNGMKLHITVENPEGVSTGVAAVTVNGKVTDGPARAEFNEPSQSVREIRIRMGSTKDRPDPTADP